MTGPSSERTADADIVRHGLNGPLREMDSREWKASLAALDRLVARNQQLQEALANLERLVLMSVTELDHECRGKCPDEDMPDMRDPDCLACSALDIAAVRARTPR